MKRRLALVVTGCLLAGCLTPALAAGASAGHVSLEVYPAPAGMAEFGEPSIGYNGRTGTVLFQSGTHTYKVDTSRPGSSWTDVTSSVVQSGGDPVLWTDRTTGRTIESQEYFTCSFALVTDDDGKSWSPSEGCGEGDFDDHQTIGSGPYPSGSLVAHPTYPNATYFCAQDGGFTGGTAYCSRSDDGGTSFGPGVPINNVPSVPTDAGGPCVPLHGKVRVGSDGSVYVPIKNCGGHAAVTVSRDAGLTWQVHAVPQSTTQNESDPSVAPAAGGTAYLAWQNGHDGSLGSRAYVAVSHDHGVTWANLTDLGTRFGVRNIEFPQAVAAGDRNAAVAFLGTTTAGDDQQGSNNPNATVAGQLPAVWHLYVAFTHDAGRHWTTMDATPHDPVQRGCISLGGLVAGGCRNLLDFNDITVTNDGDVLIALADGCINECVSTPLPPNAVYRDHPAYRAHRGTIVRINGAHITAN